VPKDENAFLKVEDERVKADCNFRKVCDCELFGMVIWHNTLQRD